MLQKVIELVQIKNNFCIVLRDESVSFINLVFTHLKTEIIIDKKINKYKTKLKKIAQYIQQTPKNTQKSIRFVRGF